MTTNDKGRNGSDRPTPSAPDVRISIGIAAWKLAYSLEEERQRYADRRQLLRQAGACIGLAVLRGIGVHHA
ncbi:MAG: hypothetical protein JNL84_01890 [Candidatus Accumulibacter sp.]|nr:hypothetical protein [Accumulibacter sp.]